MPRAAIAVAAGVVHVLAGRLLGHVVRRHVVPLVQQARDHRDELVADLTAELGRPPTGAEVQTRAAEVAARPT